MRLEEMTFEQIYLEYYNNFLTIERMAEYYGVNIELLKYWIDIGRDINKSETSRNWEEFQNDINELYFSLI